MNKRLEELFKDSSYNDPKIKVNTQSRWKGRKDAYGYIKEYLKKEIYRSYHDNPERFKNTPDSVENLIVTVGMSFEPIIQMIYILQPKNIYFLMSEEYSKDIDYRQMKADYEDYIDWMKDEDIIDKEVNPEYQMIEEDEENQDPTNKVIEKLKLLNLEGDVYVDITASKKSIIAGSFLYAIEKRFKVVYVDFADYDEEKDRPYGYTCYVKVINNPFEVFKTDEWRELKFLYENYSFNTAKKHIEKNMKIKDEKLEKLKKLMELYDDWQNGDLYSANKKYMESFENQIKVPLSVKELGERWPHGENIEELKKICDEFEGDKKDSEEMENSIYLDLTAIDIYAEDELFKINNLIKKKEDYRAAFLRAVGLFDFLQKVRLAQCFVLDYLNLNVIRGSYDLQDKQNRRRFFNSNIIGFPKGELLLKFFSGQTDNIKISFNDVSIECRLNRRIDYSFNILGKNLKEIEIIKKSDKFKAYWEMRNKSIHAYASVNDEMAREIYNMADTNFMNLRLFFKHIKSKTIINAEEKDSLKKILYTSISQYTETNNRQNKNEYTEKWYDLMKKLGLDELQNTRIYD